MILVGNQRAGAMDLANHLLKPENEHVEIHEVSGFISEDVREAFQEAKAISMGTRCIQHLFSLSLNPPQNENVAVEVFEKAITDIENKLNLSGQPRVIIFHEKEGRRHCHAVWSRIKTDEMKAINLPHYKNKLNRISKQLYLENGWKMPDGLRNRNKSNPLNFTLQEWQQAKRTGQNPKVLKAIFQECWNISDSKKAFAHALSEQGLILAKGDRRGFIAVDYRGEVYAIARYVGIKTKEVKTKLGKPDDLPTVTEAKQFFAESMTKKLQDFIDQTENKAAPTLEGLNRRRKTLTDNHRKDREKLKQQQGQRQAQELKTRAKRLRTGILGAWDWLTGRKSKIKAKNSLEVHWCNQRDQKEKQDLIAKQLAERQTLQRQIQQVRFRKNKIITELHRDIGYYLKMPYEDQEQALATRRQPKPEQRQQNHPKPSLGM